MTELTEKRIADDIVSMIDEGIALIKAGKTDAEVEEALTAMSVKRGWPTPKKKKAKFSLQ